MKWHKGALTFFPTHHLNNLPKTNEKKISHKLIYLSIIYISLLIKLEIVLPLILYNYSCQIIEDIEKLGICFSLLVTFRRRPLFKDQFCRTALRDSIKLVRNKYPLKIDAWVLLPDHFHCLWTLPNKDDDVALRWRIIKSSFTRKVKPLFHKEEWMSSSRIKRKESTIWQRRFWEHRIEGQEDYNNHFDYIHYNPVKHRLVKNVKDWEFSTFHKVVKERIYTSDWGGIDFDPDGFGE